MTLLQRLNRFPPQLCRLIARKRHGTLPMTNTDIATIAGMSRGLVSKISNLPNASWESVTVSAAMRFSLACGVNLLATSSHRRFYLNRALKYQSQASPAQKAMFNRLINTLKKSQT